MLTDLTISLFVPVSGLSSQKLTLFYFSWPSTAHDNSWTQIFTGFITLWSQALQLLKCLWQDINKKCVTILLKCICQTEVEVTILKFLESCVVYEGEDVHFHCLVSHEEAPLAQWKLQDVPLQNNEMNLIRTEGRAHSLTLRGVTTADSGTVTFTVGNHTSTASLTVRGKKNAQPFTYQDKKNCCYFCSNIWTSPVHLFSVIFLAGHPICIVSKTILQSIPTLRMLVIS